MNSQESLIKLCLKICDEIDATLLQSKIVLNDVEQDKIYTTILDIVDQKAGYPDYNHHM